MPTSVAEAFAVAGLVEQDIVSVQWNTPLRTAKPGLYVISLSNAVDKTDGMLMEAPLATQPFEQWLSVCPRLALDGFRPTVQQLMDRVGRAWIPDEAILYIGRATSLGSRLNGFYRTPIGAKRPHSGGYFLKLLSNIQQLWVHYAECPDPSPAEEQMLRRFCENVSGESTRRLFDCANPLPFANLERRERNPKQLLRKSHGIRRAREAPSDVKPVGKKSSTGSPSTRSLVGKHSSTYATQRVTAHDLLKGQIRIPSASASLTRTLFPCGKAAVAVTLNGRSLPGSWNPRTGPDRKRSGVLRVGSVLRDLVREDEVLTTSVREGVIYIEQF